MMSELTRKAMSNRSIRKVLGPPTNVDSGRISWDLKEYNWYCPGSATISLDGCFTADQLEALAWAIRNSMHDA